MMGIWYVIPNTNEIQDEQFLLRLILYVHCATSSCDSIGRHSTLTTTNIGSNIEKSITNNLTLMLKDWLSKGLKHVYGTTLLQYNNNITLRIKIWTLIVAVFRTCIFPLCMFVESMLAKAYIFPCCLSVMEQQIPPLHVCCQPWKGS